MSKLKLVINHLQYSNYIFSVTGSLKTSSGHTLCDFDESVLSINIKIPKVVREYFESDEVLFIYKVKIENFNTHNLYVYYKLGIIEFWKKHKSAAFKMNQYHLQKSKKYENIDFQNFGIIENNV